MSDLNIEEQEFKDKEMEVVEPKYKCSICADTGECENYYHDQEGELLSRTVICSCRETKPIFTSPEPETEVLDGRGMIYEILDSELE